MRFYVSYQTSKHNGALVDQGYLCPEGGHCDDPEAVWTLQELTSKFGGLIAEPSCWPLPRKVDKSTPYLWVTIYDEPCYSTGERTTYGVHPVVERITMPSWLRVMRYLSTR